MQGILSSTRVRITPWLVEFLLFFLFINFHEPTVKGPTHGVSYLSNSNALFYVQLTPSLISFVLGVNFPETLGSAWFKSYLMRVCGRKAGVAYRDETWNPRTEVSKNAQRNIHKRRSVLIHR